ncbi:MAG: N-6 DNA methylase, partial [Rickettsiales bacterium]|nr:N-6 DNA methylase [Rickettsiales bacterium]
MNTILKEGYLQDYISGRQIKATPEEIDATQVFSKQLVEDYNYPKELIQTHPQFRVKCRPSDEKKEYPIDIAVFQNSVNDDNLYIIVECKKENRDDGKKQLQDYLRLSKAKLGVWFNGNERLFLKKYEKNGEVLFEEIPNIPLYQQRLEDIGKFKRKDLKITHNLKAIFRSIRNHLAGNTKGATRDETLAKELINLIFCKIYDEKYTKAEEIVNFRAGVGENSNEIAVRIKNIFNEVRRNYKELFKGNEEILLDDDSIKYIVGELQNYYLMETERDIIADAFETFIGHALKGEQGQFFTPRNVVKSMIEILEPTKNDLIIDPACGSGGFLIEGLKYVWEQMDKDIKEYNWSKDEIIKEKLKVASRNFSGIENDEFLAKVTKVYMTLIGDGVSSIVCDDSLETEEKWEYATKQKIKLGKYDIALTNPPFGKDIKVKGENKLKQYDLAYKWNLKGDDFVKGKLKDKESPEILFIERCLQLLKENGRMGIVLPDGIFNESETYIREWLLRQVKIIAIIDICKETFQPNTSTKTSLLFFEKNKNISTDYEIFMGIAYFCGHNRRGEFINKDDMPQIINDFKSWKGGKKITDTKNSFVVKLSNLKESNFWIPKHFSPYYKLNDNNIKYVKLGDIADFKKGDEVGSENYVDFFDKNEDDTPFLRTGDLVNFSVNQMPDKFVDEKIYRELKQNLKPKDILFTKDGKIGITAMLTENDKVVISSGILRIRLKEHAKKE